MPEIYRRFQGVSLYRKRSAPIRGMSRSSLEGAALAEGPIVLRGTFDAIDADGVDRGSPQRESGRYLGKMREIPDGMRG